MSTDNRGKYIRTEEHRKLMSSVQKINQNMPETKHKKICSLKISQNRPEVKEKISKRSKGKTYEEMYGEDKATEIKQKLQISHAKQKFSKKHREKIKIGLAKRYEKPEEREKLRTAAIRRLEKQLKQNLPFSPSVGYRETEILDCIEECIGTGIIRQFKVAGYFLDGYSPELNLAFEVDEEYHKTPEMQVRDSERQSEIENRIGCSFIRLKA